MLTQVNERCKQGTIALRGNHEAGFLDNVLNDNVLNDSTFYLDGMFGGKATIDSLERSSGREMGSSSAAASKGFQLCQYARGISAGPLVASR